MMQDVPDYLREFAESNGLPFAVCSDVRIAQDAFRKATANMLKTLSYREREIVKLRYGLGDGYVYTMEEVAHIFGVTRERIRQIQKKALVKMRQPSRIEMVFPE